MRPSWQAFFCLLAPGSPPWGEGPENNRHSFIPNSGNGCWATVGSGPCSHFTIGDLLLSERTIFPSSLCPELLQFSKLTMFPFVSDQYRRVESVVLFPCQSVFFISLSKWENVLATKKLSTESNCFFLEKWQGFLFISFFQSIYNLGVSWPPLPYLTPPLWVKTFFTV